MLIDDNKSVSHLPIPPPEWCRLPRDKAFPTTYFEGGRRLPPRFDVNVDSQCSCGETVISETDVIYDTLLIYTSFMVLKAEIQTSHCKSCANTFGRIGPDLHEHGLFNYNQSWPMTGLKPDGGPECTGIFRSCPAFDVDADRSIPFRRDDCAVAFPFWF
jgi:CxC4 like cysteine cluster associated with KDZ transposases